MYSAKKALEVPFVFNNKLACLSGILKLYKLVKPLLL